MGRVLLKELISVGLLIAPCFRLCLYSSSYKWTPGGERRSHSSSSPAMTTHLALIVVAATALIVRGSAGLHAGNDVEEGRSSPVVILALPVLQRRYDASVQQPGMWFGPRLGKRRDATAMSRRLPAASTQQFDNEY